MKKIQKGKERPALQKFGLAQKRRFFKAKKNARKKWKSINAPHNTSQFIIENNSTPFYENEDEISSDFIPSSLISLDDFEEIFDEDSKYQRKISSLSTQEENTGINSHITKHTPIFTLK